MSGIHKLISKASHSGFYRWILNRIISYTVPFNAPHHFRILNIEPGMTEIMLPYRRSNLNHVKGIHACALATLCEYTIGMSLISKISEKEYRIILKNLRVDYHYQGKTDVKARFLLEESILRDKIIIPLQNADAVFHEFEIKVTDSEQNHICTGYANWQVKKWHKVSTGTGK